jgi:anaerobic sulfite reductase subunit C
MDSMQRGRPRGIIHLKEAGQVAIRLRFTGGEATANQLAAIARIARRHSDGRLHLTTRQGIEIAPVAADRAERVIAALEKSGVTLAALGAVVRSVTACPGLLCRNGVIDAQGFSKRMDSSFSDFTGAHAKIKMTVAGCPNGCPKPSEHDIGVCGIALVKVGEEGCTECGACIVRCKVGAITLEGGSVKWDKNRCISCGGCATVCPVETISIEHTGFRLFAGGKMGRFPCLGRVVVPHLDNEEQVIDAISRNLQIYREEGRKGERLGETFARLGWKNIAAA